MSRSDWVGPEPDADDIMLALDETRRDILIAAL